jgi:hypothetical protein
MIVVLVWIIGVLAFVLSVFVSLYFDLRREIMIEVRRQQELEELRYKAECEWNRCSNILYGFVRWGNNPRSEILPTELLKKADLAIQSKWRILKGIK